VEFDGAPMTDVLVGKSERSRDKPLFFRRPPDRPSRNGEGDLPDLAVRDGKWKLLCEYDGTKPELYDLAADREESTNLASDHPEIVERLTGELLQWHRALPPDGGATYVSLGKAERKNRSVNHARN
jgi:uncharacterized sulfatase